MASEGTEERAIKCSAKKRNNLMSIINSLNPEASTTDLKSSLLPSTSDDITSSTSSSFRVIQPNESSDSNLQDLPSTLEVSGNTNNAFDSLDSAGGEEDSDVMTNILHLLYQAASSSVQEKIPSENDESIVTMQNPPEGRKSGLRQIMIEYANSTESVQEILSRDVNVIFECKRCRGLFRSLPNLIRHKKEFCRNTGLMSSFLQRPTNSSKEEDAAFQQVLDTLHPPEREVVDVSWSDNATSDLSLENAPRNSKRLGDSLDVSFTEYGDNMNASAQSPAQTISVPSPAITAANTQRLSSTSQTNFGKFFVGRPSGNVPAVAAPEKKHSCPLCHKTMAERKSVRRHLLSVHSLSVVDAYKLMNSSGQKGRTGPSTRSPATIVRAVTSRSRQTPASASLLEQCVESIKLGPNRIINVLPETFPLSSVQCPVCSRELCRRTNVRRHLLEAHNLIIKGEKKYFQLKDISRNTTSTSPTLRRLRHLFTVSNRSTGSKSDDRIKSLRMISGGKTSTPISIQTSVTSTSVSFQKSSTNNSKQHSTRPILPKTEVKNEDNEANGKSNSLNLEKLKFVESSANSDSKSSTSPNTLKGSSPRNTDAAVNGSSEKQAADSDRESEDESLARLSSLRRPEYKCKKCDKRFSRELTMKNHIITFHGCEEESENNSRKQTGSAIQTCTLVEDDIHEDEPPPKKLRQLAPLGVVTTRGSSVSGNLNGSFYAASPRLISQGGSVPIALPNGNFKKLGTRNGVKNMVVQKVPSENTSTPVSSANGVRTFIKVELRNPVAVKGGDSSPSQRETKPSSFDFGKLTCFTCDKKFLSAPDLKRHLLGVHSFSTEDALAACYDCSNVSASAQKAGVEHGFDITHAKCLRCDRFYFSRENLFKHLARTHHMGETILKDLKSSFSVNCDETMDFNEEEEELNFESGSEYDQKLPVDDTPPEEKPTPNPDVVGFAKSIEGKCTPEQANEALKYFPKENITVEPTRKCKKCKHKYQRAWDLKVHLLKHLGLGFYMCNYCPKSSERAGFGRGSEMVRHLQDMHGVKAKNRENVLQECRVNYQHLWEAYGLPQGKQP